jgi:hypothetical protein
VEGAFMSKVATIEPLEGAISQLILKGDIGKLSESEQIVYYRAICTHLGLDPLTRPFDYLLLQGRKVLYLNKGGAEQLTNKHGLSMAISKTEKIEDIYLVTARSSSPTGRYADATGAVSTNGLRGNDLCNALMRAETKASRRATIRLLGLSMLDETEIETIKDAKVEVAKIEEVAVSEAPKVISASLGDKIVNVPKKTPESLSSIKPFLPESQDDNSILVTKEAMEAFKVFASNQGIEKDLLWEMICANYPEITEKNFFKTFNHAMMANIATQIKKEHSSKKEAVALLEGEVVF